MEYRKLGNTSLKVSAIGLGTEHLTSQPKETIHNVLHTAVEAGINYIDLLWENPEWWANFEPVFPQFRNRFILAAHWGGDLNQVEKCHQNFDGILTRLCNDHADIGFVTMVDTDVKWRGPAHEALARLIRYKEQGRIGYIGVSSHYGQIARKMVESGLIDMLMVPVNMFRDQDVENKNLYQACNDHGVGLVAMKPYAGGSIFIKTPAISPVQCISYALSQPISTAVTGVKSVNELQAAVDYCKASEDEKNYQAVLANIQHYLVGDCVYCNHCLPCPQNINIGLMIHIADTFQYFPEEEIQAEYETFPIKASDCIECGDCLERCPFNVDIVARLRQVVEYLETHPKELKL
jgi:hypothetical protein